jgi:hypothetical protein
MTADSAMDDALADGPCHRLRRSRTFWPGGDFSAGLGRRRAVAALWRAVQRKHRLYGRHGCLPLRREAAGSMRGNQGESSQIKVNFENMPNNLNIEAGWHLPGGMGENSGYNKTVARNGNVPMNPKNIQHPASNTQHPMVGSLKLYNLRWFKGSMREFFGEISLHSGRAARATHFCSGNRVAVEHRKK